MFEFVTVNVCSHNSLRSLAAVFDPLQASALASITAIATTNQKRSEYVSLSNRGRPKDQAKVLARGAAVLTARLSEKPMREPLYSSARAALITLKKFSDTRSLHGGDDEDWQAFKVNYSCVCSWVRTAIKLCFTFGVRLNSEATHYWTDRDVPLPHKGLPDDVQKQGLATLDAVLDASFQFARDWAIGCPPLPEFTRKDIEVIEVLIEALNNHVYTMGTECFVHQDLPYGAVEKVVAMLRKADWSVTAKPYESANLGEYYETVMPAAR